MLTLAQNSRARMESQALGGFTANASPQKRTKSSVLKSIIPGNHKRKPSSKSNNPPYCNNDVDGNGDYVYPGDQSFLPPDHPHTRQHHRENGGIRNTAVASPRKSIDTPKETTSRSGENQIVMRSVSFKSSTGRENEKPLKKGHPKDEENKMQKSNSSTNISAILLKPRSSRGVKAEDTHLQKDKENQTPPSSAGMGPPPIWAQFATQGFEEPVHTTKIPLNDQFTVEQEVALYTPRDYSPSKQRNFPDYQQPTLSRRVETKPRPKSEYIAPCPTPASFAEVVSGLQKSGLNKSQVDVATRQQQTGQVVDASRKSFFGQNSSTEIQPKAENRKVSNDSAGSDSPMPKRGSRVMAAVAAFNGKAKELPKDPSKEPETVQLDPQAIEKAFESLLVSHAQRRPGCG